MTMECLTIKSQESIYHSDKTKYTKDEEKSKCAIQAVSAVCRHTSNFPCFNVGRFNDGIDVYVCWMAEKNIPSFLGYYDPPRLVGQFRITIVGKDNRTYITAKGRGVW